MVKVMNVVFGIVLAFILFLVLLLGVKAFYPEPDYGDHGCDDIRQYVMIPCDPGATVAECDLHNKLEEKKYQESQDKIDACYKKHWDERSVYDKNLFFVYNILGVVLLGVSFIFLTTTHVSVATALSGLALNISGFTVGWNTANDMLKFLFGLLILGLVIWLTYKVNKKLHTPSV